MMNALTSRRATLPQWPTLLRSHLPSVVTVALLLVTWYAPQVPGNEVDGFTEPSKTVNVATAETGTIKTIAVHEGDVVQEGDVLASLDDDVHQAILAIAREGMATQAQRQSAQAEVNMRRQRLEKLEQLREQGHARQEEVDRARTDLEIAEANLLAAHELLQLKRLEHQKVQVQLERRLVRAPLNGVINRVRKEIGEFVAPNDPQILELVCLDPLAASFNVPSHLAKRLQPAQTVSVYLEDAAKWVEGSVDVVAPVTDAESGTIRVRVRIANPDYSYRSGERCTLQLESVPSGRQARARP